MYTDTTLLDSDEFYEFIYTFLIHSDEKIKMEVIEEDTVPHTPRQKSPEKKKDLPIDFKSLYHLPAKKAAAKLNMSLSHFKKICRQRGIQRWPARKFKALSNIIKGATNAELRKHATKVKHELLENPNKNLPIFTRAKI